ncbi:hypothetical protein WMY93_009832 [Mugilogobius chulae]|uniref:TACI cysteine-rich domain-containing protein n=1 Tax=Mugilogobius chulae TaxID=88201 RepID=A0AAW0P5T9_9GOBI
MASGCTDAEFWESLVKSCMPCHWSVNSRATLTDATPISKCKEKPGHYYDGLLKCVSCAAICRGQSRGCPEECRERQRARLRPDGEKAHKTSPAAAVRLTSISVQTAPPADQPGASSSSLNSPVLLYSLWALSVVLVLCSLALALRVFLRENKTRQDKGGSGCCQDDSNRDPGLPLEEIHRPAESSTPTENCVCVHCFPDLRASDYPVRESHPNQEAVYGGAGVDELMGLRRTSAFWVKYRVSGRTCVS